MIRLRLSRTKPDKVFYGWWIILASSAIMVMHSGIWWYGFGVLFKPLANEFHWSRTTVSAVFSLASLERLFLAPFIGLAIDRFGSRVVTLTGILLLSSGYMALSRIDSLVAFSITYALFIGLGTLGTGLAPHAAAASRWFIRRRAQVIGWISAGGGAGRAPGYTSHLSPGPRLRLAHHDRPAGNNDSGGWGTFKHRYKVVENRKTTDSTPDGGTKEEPRNGSRSGEAGLPLTQSQSSIREILKGWSFWLLVLAWCFSAGTRTAVVLHLVPLLTDQGLTAQWVVPAVQLLSFMSVASRFLIPPLADRYDIRYGYILAFLLMAAGLFGLMATTNLAIVYLAVAVLGLGQGSALPLQNAIIAPYFGRERFGTVQGWMASLGSIGGMVGPIMAGAIFDATGSYRLASSPYGSRVSCGICGGSRTAARARAPVTRNPLSTDQNSRPSQSKPTRLA